jgi:hypothetical protein
MDSAKAAGRVIGILLLVQAVLGSVVNFVLLAPGITGPSTFLTNAAPNATRLSFAALLLLVAGGVSLAISATAWMVFKRRSERLAIAYFGFGVAGIALAAVESAAIMSMLTLSKQYVEAAESDARVFEILGTVVRYGRYWAHYTHLLIGSSAVFLFYAILFRFAFVPRLLAGIGLITVIVQLTGLTMPFFGERVNFYLLTPMGICYLILAAWLLIRGFADPHAETRPVAL